MFDISFSELMVIAVVALLVIGPEKLPKVARTAGALLGRLQRYVAQIKEEIGREARFEELQKLQQEIKTGAQSLEAEVRKQMQQAADYVALEREAIATQPADVAVQADRPASPALAPEQTVKQPTRKKRAVKPARS